ncbi:hypothetical protein [Chryseobacterium sp. HMWF035]|uniref:hypothetical protein n=1 Tax=Chryseobacterium sp. HMWF035 TaxID=2056868 RepID=UPI000D57D09B|nr:hypothetical protein [Chryseobacterium sp. HMWF035]PVV53543.1 hypothetical protein DD829_18725 [Chryseobacterium sp. HMWF035]
MKQEDFDKLSKKLLLIAPNEIKIRQKFIYKRFFIFEHEELGTIGRISLRKKDFNRESIFVCEIHTGNNDPTRSKKEKLLFRYWIRFQKEQNFYFQITILKRMKFYKNENLCSTHYILFKNCKLKKKLVA